MTGNVIADAINGAPNLTGKVMRQLLGAFLPKPTNRPLGGFSGVSVGTQAATVTATAAQWTVQPHSGVLDVSAPGDGPTPYAFDQPVTGAMQAADAANPRIDLICVTHNDASENDNSAGSPAAVITYVPGVAAAQPQVPATPARSFVLAQVTVAAQNATAPAVVFVAPNAVAAGGVMPVRDASQYPAAPYIGQQIYDIALGRTRTWNGNVWSPVKLLWQGTVGGLPLANDGTWHKANVANVPIDNQNLGVGGGGGFVAPVAGTYRVSASAAYPSTSTTGKRGIGVAVNPPGSGTLSPIIGGATLVDAASTGTTIIGTTPVLVTLQTGDTVALLATQSSGSNFNLGTLVLTVEST